MALRHTPHRDGKAQIRRRLFAGFARDSVSARPIFANFCSHGFPLQFLRFWTFDERVRWIRLQYCHYCVIGTLPSRRTIRRSAGEARRELHRAIDAFCKEHPPGALSVLSRPIDGTLRPTLQLPFRAPSSIPPPRARPHLPPSTATSHALLLTSQHLRPKHHFPASTHCAATALSSYALATVLIATYSWKSRRARGECRLPNAGAARALCARLSRGASTSTTKFWAAGRC